MNFDSLQRRRLFPLLLPAPVPDDNRRRRGDDAGGEAAEELGKQAGLELCI